MKGNDGVSLECIVSSVNYAAALILQGHVVKAQVTLERVLEGSPTFTPALMLMAYLLLSKGKSVEALRIMRNSRYCSDTEETD